MEYINHRISRLHKMGFNNNINNNIFYYTENHFIYDMSLINIFITYTEIRYLTKTNWDKEILDLTQQIREQNINKIIND